MIEIYKNKWNIWRFSYYFKMSDIEFRYIILSFKKNKEI